MGASYEEMKNRIMGELKKVFRPEFLNRIDEVIVFHKLTREEIKEIVELLLKRIRESLAERELSLNLSDDAADLLVEKGWDPAMGARPLRRAIQRYIEDPLADEVLKTPMDAGSTILTERDDESKRRAEAGDGDEELKITVLPPVEGPPEEKPVPVGGPEGDEDSGSEEPESSEPEAPSES
jgi:ATP-dependent Clp protease ATP-binding subunit ClpC